MPFFLCSKPSYLEMIEKIPLGQNILNAIHLQVKLRGPNLERGDILKILKTAQENSDRIQAEEEAEIKNEQKNCETDLAKFRNAIVENQRIEFTILRHSSQNGRNKAQLQNFIDRTIVEKNDYVALSNIIKDSWDKWQTFQNNTISELDKVRDLLSKAKLQLRNVNVTAAKGSFLQLSENSEYFTNLNEIRVNFENTFVELQGFRPIITKLFQLMAKTEAVNKLEVRNQLTGLFKKIRRELLNIIDEVQANRAQQDAIFHNILESFKENLVRIEKLLERLNLEKSDLTKDAADISVSVKDSTEITHLSKEIFNDRKAECATFAEAAARLNVQVSQTRSIVAQITEIMTERFSNLKSYFIERDIKMIQINRK